MASIFVTIHEKTPADAVDAMRRVPAAAAGIELRADALGDGRLDFSMFRDATDKPLIFTRRTAAGEVPHVDSAELDRALDAKFDFVDIEYTAETTREALAPYQSRAILSFHDYEHTPAVEELLPAMRAMGCARTKIAVTPHSFRHNQRLLELLATAGRDEPWYLPRRKRVSNVTLIGMGTRGLYSRILAPFFGSELLFVVPDDGAEAAPGMLSWSRAQTIYGANTGATKLPWPEILFAVVGSPAAHSLSPAIHNNRFRAAKSSAVYSILEVSEFDDALWPFVAGAKLAPAGLSVTAPFKEQAFRFAEISGARLSATARECRAVNTLTRIPKGDAMPDIVADNTDVDGFDRAFASVAPGESAAILGAGGTARAAAVALRRRGAVPVLFNRTEGRGSATAAELGITARPLEDVASSGAKTIVNTIPASAGFVVPADALRRGGFFVDVSYGNVNENLQLARSAGMTTFDGLQFVEAQAERQSLLFSEAIAAELNFRETEQERN